jgi:hypothetical protein
MPSGGSGTGQYRSTVNQYLFGDQPLDRED